MLTFIYALFILITQLIIYFEDRKLFCFEWDFEHFIN